MATRPSGFLIENPLEMCATLDFLDRFAILVIPNYPLAALSERPLSGSKK